MQEDKPKMTFAEPDEKQKEELTKFSIKTCKLINDIAFDILHYSGITLLSAKESQITVVLGKHDELLQRDKIELNMSEEEFRKLKLNVGKKVRMVLTSEGALKDAE